MKRDELPAGLVCDNGEFFTIEGNPYLLISGRCIPFQDFPSSILNTIDATITDDHKACLNVMGFTSKVEMRKQWIACNVSRFDLVPDYLVGEKLINREYVDCSLRGVCEHEGTLCISLKQSTQLTEKHITVIKLISQGLLNKEIAQIMGITEETVKTHTKNIRDKTGMRRKADFPLFAKRYNII
jgi:DNA-binding CsgD family transcriptional regulator